VYFYNDKDYFDDMVIRVRYTESVNVQHQSSIIKLSVDADRVHINNDDGCHHTLTDERCYNRPTTVL